MNNGSRAFSSGNAENSSPFTVDAVDVATPEEQDVQDVEVTHARCCEKSSFSLLVRVIHVRTILKEDLTNSGLSLEGGNEEGSHAVPIRLVGVGTVVQEESDELGSALRIAGDGDTQCCSSILVHRLDLGSPDDQLANALEMSHVAGGYKTRPSLTVHLKQG